MKNDISRRIWVVLQTSQQVIDSCDILFPSNPAKLINQNRFRRILTLDADAKGHEQGRDQVHSGQVHFKSMRSFSKYSLKAFGQAESGAFETVHDRIWSLDQTVLNSFHYNAKSAS